MVRQEMGRIKNKIKLGAILLFPSYEEGADLEEIEKETSERFHSGKELSIFDRYFRLRLGAVIKEVARERKWKLEDFPYVAKNSHFHDRFGNIMEVFGHSVSRMALFAFPDLWKEWQFNFKGRWDGERGRERAFSAIEDILEKERSFIFTTAHCKKYRLRGMLDSFGKGNYIGINQLFCRDYWGKRINTNFEMHDRNRKLLALLFDARGSPYARKPKMSPEDITNFDRKNLYRLAGLSQSEELQWETRIEIWNYGAGYLKHIEVGKMTSLSSKVCRYHFNTTRERMTEIVSKMY